MTPASVGEKVLRVLPAFPELCPNALYDRSVSSRHTPAAEEKKRSGGRAFLCFSVCNNSNTNQTSHHPARTQLTFEPALQLSRAPPGHLPPSPCPPQPRVAQKPASRLRRFVKFRRVENDEVRRLSEFEVGMVGFSFPNRNPVTFYRAACSKGAGAGAQIRWMTTCCACVEWSVALRLRVFAGL